MRPKGSVPPKGMPVRNYDGSCVHQVQSKMADNSDAGLLSEKSSMRDGHSNYIIYSNNSNAQLAT